MTQQAIMIAAKLYQCRASLRALWGGSYHARIADPMRRLKESSDRRGVGVLELAQKLAKAYSDEHQGFAAIVILVAAVEILEPSK